MRKLMLILLLCQVSYSQIAEDKKKHFVAGAFAGAIANSIAYGVSKNPKKAFIYGVCSSILVGSIKEYIDEKNYKGWDNEDLLFTALGGVSVNIPLTLIETIHEKKEAKRLKAFKIK
jgi:uncharacterized protein YfiM (DUF2279 family)